VGHAPLFLRSPRSDARAGHCSPSPASAELFLRCLHRSLAFLHLLTCGPVQQNHTRLFLGMHQSGHHGIREKSGIAGFQVDIGAQLLCLQSQGVGVATRPVDEGSEGAIRLLECRRLVDGDGNYGPLSSHGECRARGEVRRHVSQGSKHYLRACECRYGSGSRPRRRPCQRNLRRTYRCLASSRSNPTCRARSFKPSQRGSVIRPSFTTT
jgi:hypothetical protein